MPSPPAVLPPSSVEYIGSGAFAYFPVVGITVDERNERYASKDGCLLNAAGDVLMAVPCSSSQVILIPEGVAALGAFAMWHYSTDYKTEGYRRGCFFGLSERGGFCERVRRCCDHSTGRARAR